ncbi:MAG: tetratricopeptide repeat protein, partial [Xanthomonadales bacterium]|nr:tetratricopeptide repeat protein [Xanthomonadales bacterium]
SRFAELRGDVLRAQGDLPAALDAYESALEFSDTGVGYRPLLEMKITELAGATGVADDLPMDGVES